MMFNKLLQGGRNKRLVFRSYLIIVIGIVGVGLLLDFFLARSLSNENSEINHSTRIILTNLVVSRLSDVPTEELQGVALQIETEINVPVHLLNSNDVTLHNSSLVRDDLNNSGSIGYTEDDQAMFYYNLPRHQSVVTIGPLPLSEINSESWIQMLVPILFYSTVVALVWIWIRPLLKDLDLLSDAADNIKDDFNYPMPDFDSITTIKPLADGFESMTQQLRNLIESQKEFSNAISHEVRTPLARIKFSLAALDDELPAPLSEHSTEIHNNVNEIDQLLDAMLKYARLEHPDTIVSWQSLSIQELLSLVESNKQSNTMIEFTHVGSTPDQIIACDPHLMVLAVSNLIENAMRYANKRIRITLQATNDDVGIVVEDDGSGIPQDQHQAVIKAFSSINHSDKNKSGGYGLGLAIVKRIANLHHGDLLIGNSEFGGAKLQVFWSSNTKVL